MIARVGLYLSLLLVSNLLPAQQNLIAPSALFRLASPAAAPVAKPAAPPDIQWDETQTTLGYQAVGDARSVAITLQNPGEKPLEVSRISCSCQQVQIDDPQLTIEAGSSGTIELILRPTEASAFKCFLTLYANTAEWIHIIPLEGIAYTAP